MTTKIERDSDGWNINPLYRSEGKRLDNPLYEGASLPESPGKPLEQAVIKDGATKAAKKEGTTLSKIGNGILRGLAGVAGGLLYGTAFVVGGGLSLAVGLPALLIAAPPTLIGAGIGAIIGAAIPSSTAKEGAIAGAKEVGLPAVIVAGAFPEYIVAAMPKILAYTTIGRLGAGLCAFAATGKTKKEQLEGDRFKVYTENGRDVREKATKEKLLEVLCFASFPWGSESIEDIKSIFDDKRNPHKPLASDTLEKRVMG